MKVTWGKDSVMFMVVSPALRTEAAAAWLAGVRDRKATDV